MAELGTVGWVCIGVAFVVLVLGGVAGFLVFRYCKCKKAKASAKQHQTGDVTVEGDEATATPIFTAVRSRSLEKFSKSRETMRPCEIFEKPPPTWNPPVSPSEDLVSFEIHPDYRVRRPPNWKQNAKLKNQKRVELDVEATQEDDHHIVQSIRPVKSSQSSTNKSKSERVSSPTLEDLPSIEKMLKRKQGPRIDDFWTPICESFIRLKLVNMSDGAKLKMAFENTVNKPTRGRKGTKHELQMILMGVTDGFGILESMIDDAHEKTKSNSNTLKSVNSAFFAHYAFIADFGKPLVHHLIKQTDHTGWNELCSYSAPLLFAVALRRDFNLKLRILAFAIMRKRLNEIASHLPDNRLAILPYPVNLMPDVKNANEAIFDVTESIAQERILPMDKTQCDSHELP
uniref:ANK_REP_REGION domain-containing protein n=1 Tax=Panagrellus redivivus TaxID=6233 RepID=A0A7E4UQL4_PANRE